MIAQPRVSLFGLRVSMFAIWLAVVGTASLLLTALILYLGLPTFYIYGVIGFVVLLNIIQWLFGPYLINAVYRVTEADQSAYPWLYQMVDDVARRSGMRERPKVMIANIDLPNAFAYGSPLTGPMVAVTSGLLGRLPREELEAVIAHEVGHLKHRDVVVMLMISLIPAIIYYIGYTLYVSGLFGGSRRNGGGAAPVLIGIGLIVLSFIFNLFVFLMSRLREYYADSHAATVVSDGARRLQRALVRIMALSGRVRPESRVRGEQLKMFFISDPEHVVEPYVDVERVVEELRRSKPGPLSDLFSTHPHPAKRIKHLDRFIYA
ncbi:MAG: zinc metalloprotease HtpX [Nitrososphaerota archaeon]|nr:zinc metalloprotease HtpX [Candidatus Calditenuaceae archaeon]MDW8073350.1 zinc metalloprotease HtpX [Nitrososphaerota archaeon]